MLWDQMEDESLDYEIYLTMDHGRYVAIKSSVDCLQPNGYDTDRLAGVLQNHDVRYRLAEGPLQQSLIRSLAILDIMVLEWSIKMPSELESFEWIQQDLAYRLPLSSHMLVQILTVELAIGDIWRIVIEDYMSRTLDSESVS